MTPVKANETKLVQLQRRFGRTAPAARWWVFGVVSLMAAMCLSPPTFAQPGPTTTFTELKSVALLLSDVPNHAVLTDCALTLAPATLLAVLCADKTNLSGDYHGSR